MRVTIFIVSFVISAPDLITNSLYLNFIETN
jgi:hypothetical protein